MCFELVDLDRSGVCDCTRMICMDLSSSNRHVSIVPEHVPELNPCSWRSILSGMQTNPRAREASFASLQATWQKQQEEQAPVAQPQVAHDAAASGSHAAAVPALPEGWHAVWDARYNTYYYCHPASGTTTWELPDSSSAAPAAAATDALAPSHQAAGPDSYTPTGFGATPQAVAPTAEPAAQPHAAAVQQLVSSSTAPVVPAAVPPHAPQQQQPHQQQQPQSTASGWYYHDPQGRECGPFTMEQLKGWRSGLPMSLLVWYREGPDAKQQKQQRGAKRKRKAAAAHLVLDLPQHPHQQLFGVAMPVQQQTQQPPAASQEGSPAAPGPGECSSSGASEADTSSSDDEAGVEFEIDSGGQLRVVVKEGTQPEPGVEAKEIHSADEEQQQQQQQQQQEEEEEEASPGACDASTAAAASGSPSKEPPAAAAAAAEGGASKTDDPAATAPPAAAAAAAADPQGGGAVMKEEFFDSPAIELAELLGDSALLAHWRATTAAQQQQAAWLGGRPAAAAAPSVAPPAPVWQQWCLQHHQQQQKERVMAAAAQLKEAGAAGSSAASYAAAVLAGLPAEDEAVQLAAAAVRYGQSLDQVLQSAWTAGPAKPAAAAAAAPQQRSSYVKDPRSGRLKLVVEEGDPASQSFHAKELYGDLARWIDPVALEQSLTAAARAKRRAAAGGGHGVVQEAGGVGAGSGGGSGGGRQKGASKKSRVVV